MSSTKTQRIRSLAHIRSRNRSALSFSGSVSHFRLGQLLGAGFSRDGANRTFVLFAVLSPEV